MGQDIARLSHRKLARHAAFVQQDVTTDSAVTVNDVVRLGRTPHCTALSGWTTADEAAVVAALAQVDMTGRRAQGWQTLSGGERQRVHIARAFAQTPQVMFLDKPTNHLDIHHQIEILRLVRLLDLTSDITLHDLKLVSLFCDRIFVLHECRVVALAPPETVLSETLLRDVFRIKAKMHDGGCPVRSHIRFLAA